MVQLETYRTKEDGFLLILIRLIESSQNLIFALDPWKFGFVDFEKHQGSLKELKLELNMPTIKFHNIKKKKAARLLRDNYDIANELGIEVSDGAMKWLKKLGIFNISSEGTLYKCFNCQEGDLKHEEVDEILEVARDELKEGKIGSEEEEQYFYICDTCKEEMHQSHT